MDAQARRRVGGTVLIVLGFVLFLLQFVGNLGGAVTMLAIGGVFIFSYFTGKSFGLLIPGCIFVGLALGDIFSSSDFTRGDFNSFGLGLGFIAIYIIHLLYEGKNSWWPLIPGGILVLNSVAGRSERFETFASVAWPLVFVLIGAWLVLRSRSGGREPGVRRGSPSAPPAGSDRPRSPDEP